MTAEAKRLGKYEIIEELGKAAFATVYRARDPDLTPCLYGHDGDYETSTEACCEREQLEER